MDRQQLVRRELQGCVEFFLQFSNLNPADPGYGLTVDSTKNPAIASIAATGFALTAWVIAAERGMLPQQQAAAIALGTLRTLAHQVSHHRGFFAHFLHMQSGQRVGKCEYSTIDTGLCLNGVITAAAYFRDAEIQELAEQLLQRVDWNFIVFERDGRTLLRMAYNPDPGGDYVQGSPGFIHQWDMAAEQKLLYLQAAAQIDPPTAVQLYRGFSRDTDYVDGQPIVFNPGGNLFAYQFSEAWLDTAVYLDPDGIDWFENSRRATLANRAFCIAQSARFKTYHERSWGLSCGDSPWGYDVSGSPPWRAPQQPNGTVSIAGATASLPFAPEPVLAMLTYLAAHHPQTWGPYGFYDAYNLDVTPPWYSRAIYAINKGCALLMLENYLSRLVWETYTDSPTIRQALRVLGFTARTGRTR